MKKIFIDTNAFFRGKDIFLRLIENNYKLVTSTIVVYEFLKVIDELILEEKNIDRRNLYIKLRDRFPSLIDDLDIEILSHKLSVKEIQDAFVVMKEKSIDIGDALIYLLLRRESIQEILTYDDDWKRLSVNIIQ